MNVQTTTQQLVHKVLTMIVCQFLTGVDNSMHICLHEVGDDVDVLVTRWCRWLLHINQSNDIFMIEEFYTKDE